MKPHIRNLTLVIMVSATELRAIVVEADGAREIQVLFSQEARLPRHLKSTEREWNTRISSALYRLLHGVEQAVRKEKVTSRITKMEFFYAPPFSAVGTKEIVLNSEKKLTLSVDIIQSAIFTAEENFLASFRNTAKYITMERELVSTHLDGYPVESYLMRQYNHFAGQLVLGAVNENLAQKLSDVSGAIFGEVPIMHRTLTLSVLDRLHELDTARKQFLYCMVLPDTSVFVHVRNAAPVVVDSFPFGNDKINSRLAQALSVTPVVVHSYARMYTEGKFNGDSVTRIERACADISDEWFKEFSLTLSRLEIDALSPKVVYLLPSSETAELVFTTTASDPLPVARSAGRERAVLTGSQFLASDSKIHPYIDSMSAALVAFVRAH